jgi:phosphotransferase system HPr (HPr) family protein
VSEARRTLVVRDRDGLHARPCARIAQAANSFRGEVTVAFEGSAANAKSIVQLLGLMVPGGAALEFKAEGPDADRCLDAIEKALAEG